jgi:GNAT superfamily N-acetyltransferase
MYEDTRGGRGGSAVAKCAAPVADEAMRIRPAAADDIPAMHRIRLAVRENRLTAPEAITEADYRPYLGATGRSFVAESENGMAGFAVLDFSKSRLWALFVAPEAEGQGTGRALHRALLAAAAAEGIERLWLTTGVGTRAAAFYCRLGWLEVGRSDAGEVRLEREI